MAKKFQYFVHFIFMGQLQRIAFSNYLHNWEKRFPAMAPVTWVLSSLGYLINGYLMLKCVSGMQSFATDWKIDVMQLINSVSFSLQITRPPSGKLSIAFGAFLLPTYLPTYIEKSISPDSYVDSNEVSMLINACQSGIWCRWRQMIAALGR